MYRKKNKKKFWMILGILACVGWSAGAVRAQDGQETRDEESSQSAPPMDDWQHPSDRNLDAENGKDGPVRLARFSLVDGDVSWRPDSDQEWSAASLNLPLRQGAQVYVREGGRAELQFDDGSLLRLGAHSVLTLHTLFSDADGEFTELKMTDGLATLALRHKLAVYQIDTPYASVKASGPAKLRLEVNDSVHVIVRSGKASVEGRQGEVTLNENDALRLRGVDDPLDVRRAPDMDGWDRWNVERDQPWEDEARPVKQYVPSDVALTCPDLDDYGTWHNDAHYGYVWCPRVSSVDWRPYNAGHWVWVNPFGWTWVSSEPWGWAPYHYGSWVHSSYGWGWVPGPRYQYWCPAVVHFSEYHGAVAWAPLAPEEVCYPSRLSLGFRGGNWALYFSIGQAAVYYPGAHNVCIARPWNTVYINRRNAFDRYRNSAEFQFAANHNTYLHEGAFVPRNARLVAGVTVADTHDFGGRGPYRAVGRDSATYFAQGRNIAAPLDGRRPVAGPVAATPTVAALTPSRIFSRDRTPSRELLTRPVIAPNRRTAIRTSPEVGGSTERITSLPRRTWDSDRAVSPGMERRRDPGVFTPTTPGERRTDSTFNRTDRSLETRQPRVTDSDLRRAPSRMDSGQNAAEQAALRARRSLGLPTRTGRQDTVSPLRPANEGTETHGRTSPEINDSRRFDNGYDRRSRTSDSTGSSRRDTTPSWRARDSSGDSSAYTGRTRDPLQGYTPRRSDSSSSDRPSYRSSGDTARSHDDSASYRTYRTQDRSSSPERSYSPRRDPSPNYTPRGGGSSGSSSRGSSSSSGGGRREAGSSGGGHGRRP